MKDFILYQVAFDGDYVKDSEHKTLEEAEETSANLGSKWFFYPFSVIVKGQTIVETGGSLVNMQTDQCLLSEKFKGKRFKTLLKIFKEASEKEFLQNVDPIEFENYLI